MGNLVNDLAKKKKRVSQVSETVMPFEDTANLHDHIPLIIFVMKLEETKSHVLCFVKSTKKRAYILS